MKAYILPRLGGKTTKLIELAAERGGYIVCLSRKDTERIAYLAQKLNLDIHFPITFQELLDRERTRGVIVKEFYFDDLDRILAAIAGTVSVAAFSMTGVVEQEQTQ